MATTTFISTLAELSDAKIIAQKLINLGVDEEDAVKFVLNGNTTPASSSNDLHAILPSGSCEYTQETCQNPMCRCDEGGFIETITHHGRMMTPVLCGCAQWKKSKFERI